MSNLNKGLKQLITRRTDGVVSIALVIVWFLALVFAAVLDRIDGPVSTTILVIAFIPVNATVAVLAQRRIAHWVAVSYNAGAIASTTLAYQHRPQDLREIADIIEQENK